MKLWGFTRQHSGHAPRQVTIAKDGFDLHGQKPVSQPTNATAQKQLTGFKATGHAQRTIGVWTSHHVKTDHFQAFNDALLIGARVAVNVDPSAGVISEI